MGYLALIIELYPAVDNIAPRINSSGWGLGFSL